MISPFLILPSIYSMNDKKNHKKKFETGGMDLKLSNKRRVKIYSCNCWLQKLKYSIFCFDSRSVDIYPIFKIGRRTDRYTLVAKSSFFRRGKANRVVGVLKLSKILLLLVGSCPFELPLYPSALLFFSLAFASTGQKAATCALGATLRSFSSKTTRVVVVE